MTRITAALTLATLAALSIPLADVRAAFIAQAGFNDASGINSDATPDSPYVLGSFLGGRGSGEPGWAGVWEGGPNVVLSSAVFEGDGAARFSPSTQMWRTLSQHVQFYHSEQYVRMTANASMVAYTMQLPGNEIDQGAIWQVHPDGTFWVIDGVEDGATIAPAEYSGFNWSPGEWYKVTVDINMINRSWDFYVNDVKYDAPDPLGFRGNPAYIDRVSYLTEGAGSVFLDSLTITPEPSTMAIASLGAAFLLVSAGHRRLTCWRRKAV